MLKLYLCLLVFSISCYADNIVTVNSSENDFDISLRVNQSTGYGWYLADYNSQLITPIKTEIVSINNKQIGSPKTMLWRFKVNSSVLRVPQITKLNFVELRPWVGKIVNAIEYKIILAGNTK